MPLTHSAAQRGAACEAHQTNLDDGGVERVEVQQQHKAVVQPLLGLQDQAAWGQEEEGSGRQNPGPLSAR